MFATLPGLLLIGVISVVSITLHTIPVMKSFSALIIAIILGMAIRNSVGIDQRFQVGITFGLKRILRFAVALLGLQLSFTQLEEMGWAGFIVVALSLTATFLFTSWLGRKMGIDRKLTQLIAAGTSICGASAVIAVNTVTEGSDEDVAYSIGTVSLFGTIATICYPLLGRTMHLPAPEFGMWAGASIHEVAQVVAAAFQGGALSGQFGTISKLARVMMLAPVVIALGLANSAGGGDARFDWRRVTVPWFVLGFVALVVVGSLHIVSASVKADVAQVSQFLLAMALAAMGLETHFGRLRKLGLKPVLLAGGASAFISALSLLLIRLVYL